MTRWTTIAIEFDTRASAELVLASTDGGLVATDSLAEARAQKAVQSAKFEAKEGGWLDVGGNEGSARLIVIGVGSTRSEKSYFTAGGYVIDAMRSLRVNRVRVPQLADEELESFVRGALLHGFRLEQGRRNPGPLFHPEALVVSYHSREAADRAAQLVVPINRARAWVEQPANLLTPEVFAEEARIALEAAGLTVRILGLDELKAIGAQALLAVASGSHEEPRLLVAEWRGDSSRDKWDAALVGKGVTYDSGGLNLKSRPVIEKMKFDMGGAAAVLGAAEALALRKARSNVVVVVPMTENSVGSAGYRPGDVIGSLAGLTIEVINTDAEGRLILADGISYAIKNYSPRSIVDVATLTGAITGILHEEFAGLYSSDDALAEGLIKAGESVGEALWRLPLSSDQNYLVDSSVADVANLGAAGFLGLGHGSPTAGAKFIQRFTEGSRWAHIDIAGTAWATRRTHRSSPGATGFGVATLDRWVESLEGELAR